MKSISTLIASAAAWCATAAALVAGEAPAPVVDSDTNDGIVALFVVLGVLVIVGGIMKPKAPPPDEEG